MTGRCVLGPNGRFIGRELHRGPARAEGEVNRADASLWHPWLRINRVLRAMATGRSVILLSVSHDDDLLRPDEEDMLPGARRRRAQ